jgi:flagellar biosynthesis/type III secretory pathway protein FliH
VISSAPPPPLTPAPPAPPSAPPVPVRDPNSEAFARAVVEHAAASRRALATVEEQLLELSVQLAEVLVEREIEREPALLGTLARAALSSLDGIEPVAVRASRASYGAIVDTFGGPSIEFEGVQVRVVLDTKLEGVGVVVEGPDTRVDGRVGDRLRSALRAMQDERARRESEVAS